MSAAVSTSYTRKLEILRTVNLLIVILISNSIKYIKVFIDEIILKINLNIYFKQFNLQKIIGVDEDSNIALHFLIGVLRVYGGCLGSVWR